MSIIKIPTPLRQYTDQNEYVKVNGKTIKDVMEDLVKKYPNLKKHLYNEENTLRNFVNIYLNNEDVRTMNGIKTSVEDNDVIFIVPAVAGGL